MRSAIARFSNYERDNNALNKGGLLLGICNGFQILAMDCFQVRFYTTTTKSLFAKTPFLKHTSSAGITENVNKNKAYKIPIAHGEGRYYAERSSRRLVSK